LSRELAQAMGGGLWGTSQGEGRGAVFTLTLTQEIV
jgi:signal transduction histidine kinase